MSPSKKMRAVTGLKIANGLKCTRQRTSGHEASMEAGGHVHQEVNIEGGLGTSSGGEQTGKIQDTHWTMARSVLILSPKSQPVGRSSETRYLLTACMSSRRNGL
jgi:hypothetical protein